MISSLLIHPDILQRVGEAERILTNLNLTKTNPNVLWFDKEEKLGIGEARKIKDFLSLKPYQGENQAVVLISAENLTLDAQNALLKTLEEPSNHVSIILGVGTEDTLLPTIISRCQIIQLQDHNRTILKVSETYQKQIEKLINSSYEERFEFIEKLENREEFLSALTKYFRHELIKKSAGVNTNPPQGWTVGFLKDLVEAEKWAHQNVNNRAILEYLMLKMPQVSDQR